jgi:thermostable 8-oxoguanine DNA glycosylase
MSDNRWHKDLERGKKIEREVLERMLAIFKQTYQTFGKDSRFDIKIPELQITIEVKFDPKSLETGNLVVEYYHNQSSGLSTSEASHWLFVTGTEEIWISKFQLLKCILAERIMPTRIHGPG